MSSSVRRPKGDGSIYQRPDGRWVGRIYFEDPVTGLFKRTQVSAKSKTAVSARLKEMRERLDQGVTARDDGMAFGTFAIRWLESSLAASDRRSSTKTLYAGLTRTHILGSDLASTPLKRLRPTTVERFITGLRAKGLADSTVRQIFTVARAIGETAVRDGLLGLNPFVAVRRPRIRAREATFLSPVQVAKLLAAAAGSRYQPLLELLVHTGLRRGEALGLKWRDIDLAAGTLRVRGTLSRVDGTLTVTDPKSDRSRRTIPLSEPAIAVLRSIGDRTILERQRAEDLWVNTSYVFVTEVGEPCDPRNALRALRIAAKASGLPGVSLHTLRHTAASVMLSNGVPIPVVSKLLGHSGIAITVDVYGHVSPEVSRDALSVLATALSDAALPAQRSAQ